MSVPADTTYWDREAETADPDVRQERLLQRSAFHLSQLLARSPLIAGRLRAAGVDPRRGLSLNQLQEIAPITKGQIIEDQAGNPPYGSFGAPPGPISRLYVSPGPEAIFFTRADYEAIARLGAWVFYTNGFRPGDLVDVCVMYHWFIAGTAIDDSLRTLGCGTVPGGVGGVEVHLENARMLKLTGLMCFPTFLAELAARAREKGIDPARDLNLRICSVAGEMHSPQLKRELATTFGASVREWYGGAEVPFVASECGCSEGMHLNPAYVVEIVDPDTLKPVEPGQPGEILLTESEREAMPMLRYRTGDITSGLLTSLCPCGRTMPRIGRIIGRNSDVVRIKGVFVVPREVERTLSRFPELGRYQLVVDRPERMDRLTVRIESRVDHDRTVFRAEVARALKDGIRITADVELVPMSGLEGQPTVMDRRRI